MVFGGFTNTNTFGASSAAFTPTKDTNGSTYNKTFQYASISAMDAYKDKTYEELRLAQHKNQPQSQIQPLQTTNQIQPQPQPAQTSIFGQPASTTTTNLFQPTTTSTSLFKPTSSTSLFGSKPQNTTNQLQPTNLFQTQPTNQIQSQPQIQPITFNQNINVPKLPNLNDVVLSAITTNNNYLSPNTAKQILLAKQAWINESTNQKRDLPLTLTLLPKHKKTTTQKFTKPNKMYLDWIENDEKPSQKPKPKFTIDKSNRQNKYKKYMNDTKLFTLPNLFQNPNSPTISNEYLSLGYSTLPSLSSLRALSDTELQNVPKFTIKRQGFGQIEWNNVDIAGLSISSSVIEITSQSVDVYSQKLNKSAQICIRMEVPEEFEGSKEDFRQFIQEYTKEMNGEFLSYEEGLWKFSVTGFN